MKRAPSPERKLAVIEFTPRGYTLRGGGVSLFFAHTPRESGLTAAKRAARTMGFSRAVLR